VGAKGSLGKHKTSGKGVKLPGEMFFFSFFFD